MPDFLKPDQSGGHARVRKEIESPIESFNAERLQADIKVTESAMTPDTFKGSWDAGASLDIDEFLTLIKDLELSN